MKKGFIFVLVLLGSIMAQAAVPHTFTAGTPAKASEVNANFSDVEKKACIAAYNEDDSGELAHPLTYSAKTLAVGSTVTLNGSEHKLIAVPFEQPTTGDIYKVKMLVSQAHDNNLWMRIRHINSSTSMPCANITISGYPAYAHFLEEAFIHLHAGGYSEVWLPELTLFVLIGELILEFHSYDLGSETGLSGSYTGDYDLENEVLLKAHKTEYLYFDNLIDYIKIEKASP